MNPLLVKPARRVVRVETPSRPELTLYVRAINGREFTDLGSRISNGPGLTVSWGAQLEAYLCDAEGAELLAVGEGIPFMESLEAADVRRLVNAAAQLNSLDDEAVEEELKN